MIDPILAADEFAGRVCIVTGAARGIGAAIAESLASRGGVAVICDINLDAAAERAQLFTESGYRAEARRVDVADGDDVRRMVDEVTARLGPPAVLINNAGRGHRRAVG